MLDDILVYLILLVFFILAVTIIAFLYRVITGKPFWPAFKKMMGHIVKWI